MPRHVSHLLVVLMALAVALLSSTHLTKATTDLSSYVPGFDSFSILPTISYSQYLRPPLVLSTFTPKRAVPDVGKPVTQTEPIESALQPFIEQAQQPRQEIINYNVVEGDTVSDISERFDISSATIVWASELRNADSIKLGQKLVILPLSGVLHTVSRGDTLESIAVKYKVRPQVIAEYPPNQIERPELLSIGQKLIVPGGQPPPPPPVYVVAKPRPAAGAVAAAAGGGSALSEGSAEVATGDFMWPTSGPIFTYFSGSHLGVDISPPYGSSIYAAESGTVIQTEKLGWSYGWYLVIDHGNGFSTLYSHVSEFLVNVGDRVSKGQPIARVGNTGKSTGPHLHFEIWQHGQRVDPLAYLPR